MVKRLLILICLLSVPIASFSQQSNCPPPRAGSLSDLPFQDGEVLLYSLSYNWGGVVSSVAEGSSKLKFNNKVENFTIEFDSFDDYMFVCAFENN